MINEVGRTQVERAILGVWDLAAVGRCDAKPEEVDVNLKRDPVLYSDGRMTFLLVRDRGRTMQGCCQA